MEKTIYCQPYRNLVTKIKAARLQKGLTQFQAARKIGRSRAWLGRIESAQLRLDPVSLVIVSRVCGIHASRLVAELEKELPR
jgi:transcriptional regulator with XRE-family HTH domain